MKIIGEINLSSGKIYRFDLNEYKAQAFKSALTNPEVVSIDIPLEGEWRWFNKEHIQSARIVEYEG